MKIYLEGTRGELLSVKYKGRNNNKIIVEVLETKYGYDEGEILEEYLHYIVEKAGKSSCYIKVKTVILPPYSPNR